MLYFRKTEAGDLEQVASHTPLRTADGVLHSFDAFLCWTDAELAEKGFYRHKPEPIPEGFLAVGTPMYRLQGDTVVEHVQLAALMPYEPEPAPPAPPAPPPMDVGVEIVRQLEATGLDVSSEEAKAVAGQMVHSDIRIEDLFAFGGIVMRQIALERAGQWHQGHRHNYDHVTQVVRGSVTVQVGVDGPIRKYDAPANVPIRAEDWHKIVALTDDVLYYCTYRMPEGDIELNPIAEAAIEDDEAVRAFHALLKNCAGCGATCAPKK